MKKKIFLIACFLSIVTCFYGMDVYIDVKSTGRKINISLTDIAGSDVSRQISEIVRNDLAFSGVFNAAAPGQGPALESKFDFSKSDRDAAVLGSIDTAVKFDTSVSGKNISLVAVGWDVASANKIFGEKYASAEDGLRAMAHSFSDDILRYVTGQQLKFDSKIAFSCTASGSKEIWCTDYDGGNVRRLTYNNSISILPRFSHDDRYLFYTTYRDGNPDVFRYDFKKGISAPFLTYQGINIIGSFSPDGKYIIATLSKDGDPELYLFTPGGAIIRRLTFSPGVDTGASFSPNSNEFVFVSGRGGIPNLYIMDVEGSNLRKITHDGYNDSPCWSPAGDKIVFSKRSAGGFDIYLLDVATQKETQLTQNSGSNENPTFSPDGRYISFSSSRRGRWEIYIMSSDGSGQKLIPSVPKNSVNPAWSH